MIESPAKWHEQMIARLREARAANAFDTYDTAIERLSYVLEDLVAEVTDLAEEARRPPPRRFLVVGAEVTDHATYAEARAAAATVRSYPPPRIIDTHHFSVEQFG